MKSWGGETLNPRETADQAALRQALAEATETATALPSVKFLGSVKPRSVAELLPHGVGRELIVPRLPRAIVYTAENHNHAAELLADAVGRALGPDATRAAARVRYLNTVIGKMSGVVTDA